ncbi:MAG: endo alpha-1,4 polygalactosaminidase [Byssovorax sp.]
MLAPTLQRAAALALVAPLCVAGCGAGSGTTTGTTSTTSSSTGTGGNGQGGSGQGGSGAGGEGGQGGGSTSSKRGFPVAGPWASFYGPAEGLDLGKVASTFRVINIDVDPDTGNFTDAEIQTLRAGGKNIVLSYMNVGSCENYRSYWSKDPPGHKSCVGTGALTAAYDGYPDEKWADLSSLAYHDLIVNYVAPRLAARGIDGFYLDNMEVVEHGANEPNGPCGEACSQGGLDLIWELRQKFPDLLIVMQNASSDVTRLGKTHGVDYPSVLDGLSHEEVYTKGADPGSLMEMLAWKAMNLTAGGHPFWLAAEDYVGECSAAAKGEAKAIYDQAKADGLNEYVTDESGMQQAPCFWGDF